MGHTPSCSIALENTGAGERTGGSSLRGWAGGLTEHLNVPFGDGIEAAAGKQDNVGLGGLRHCPGGRLTLVQGSPLFMLLVCLREKGRRASWVECCGLQEAVLDAKRVTPRLPLTLGAPARSEAAFVVLSSVLAFSF